MEIFIGLTIIVLIVTLVYNGLKQIQTKLDFLKKEIDKNQDSLKSIKKYIEDNLPLLANNTIIPEPSNLDEKPKEVIFVAENNKTENIKELEIEPEPIVDYQEKVLITFPDIQTQPVEPKTTKQPKKPVFDWEKFIGENLINKIGIAILTIGIGIFVKFAIDNHWINEIGRVCIGILAGAILLGTAHYLRKGYKAFSSVLVGGGIAILYFTIGIAFHEYQLLTQTLAFICMTVITVFAVMLSLGYNRIEIALIALIGGFATPFMVSTGAGNHVILFSYLIILNLGMLSLSYFKKWNLVYATAYVLTIIIYGLWFFMEYKPDNLVGALSFASVFYFIFFTAATIFNIRKQQAFLSFDFFMVLSLNLCFYSLGIQLLSPLNSGIYKGIFTITLALINFIIAFWLHKKLTIDKNFVYLIIALVLTYVTLVAPVQLSGNQITLFWAAEAVILLWLSQKSGIFLMKIASFILLPLMIISLIIDWVKHYDYLIDGTPMWPIANQPFITGVGILISLGLFIKLLYQEKIEKLFETTVTQIISSIRALMVIMAFLVGFLEVNYQAKVSENTYDSIYQYVADYAFIAGFLAILWIIVAKKQLKAYGYVATLATGWFFVILFIFINAKIIDTRNLYLFSSGYPVGFFLTHYIIIISSGFILTYAYKFIKINFITLANALIWMVGFISICLLSIEIDHNWAFFTHPVDASHLYEHLKMSQKVLYPIAWGLTSFVLMYIGLKKKIKQVRIFSLALFGVILLKLFTIDLLEMSAGGRIAAFISLGILLLVMSFLYQKLKKLVLESE